MKGKTININFQDLRKQITKEPKQEERKIMSVLREDFEIEEKPSDYLNKFKLGDTKIRILSAFIDGWQDWDDKKPIRTREKPENPSPNCKQFLTCIVWNYNVKAIQIMTITQVSILRKLIELIKNKDWGPIFFYDININRKGEGMLSKYETSPLPHKALSPHIEKAFRDKPINLNVLFEDGDPFEPGQKHYTPGVFSANDVGEDTNVVVNKTITEDPFKKKITREQVKELSELIGDDDDYREHFYEKVRKSFGSPNLGDIPASQFEKLRGIIEQHNISRLDEEMRNAG